MTEKELLNRIREKRKKAIDIADRNQADKFLNQPSSNVLIVILIIAMIAASVLISCIVCPLIKPVYKQPIITDPVIIEHINKTEIVNKTEVVIKGEKEMICIGAPNSTKLSCYRRTE